MVSTGFAGRISPNRIEIPPWNVTPFLAAIKRIPLFQGLTPEQAMVILKSCQNQSVAAQQTLCNFGEPSDKMFILL